MKNEDKNINDFNESDLVCEIDMPFDDINKTAPEISTDSTFQKQMNELDEKINFHDRMDKHVYKRHGLNLIIGCGVAYFIIIIADTIIFNIFLWDTSPLTNGFVELLKYIISTLIGFVFSEIKKDKSP